MVDKLRKRILEVAYRDGMGHIPSALSILDIIWCLYDKVMTKDDQFVLSKGHGVMALYAVLEEKGLLDWSTKLMGHPKRGGAILASTGSLGHGLPMAIGLALSKKVKGEVGRVFCLVGDGECNEGTTWESALLAAHHKLDNLVVIIDQNGSSERALSVDKLEDKFKSFGWYVSSFHGNDIKFGDDEFPEEWDNILGSNSSGRPWCIVSYNTKGHGVSFMERDNSWHNRKLTEHEYQTAIL